MCGGRVCGEWWLGVWNGRNLRAVNVGFVRPEGGGVVHHESGPSGHCVAQGRLHALEKAGRFQGAV